MKNKILDVIHGKQFASFGEIESIVDGFSGDHQLRLNDSVVVWDKISKEAAEAIIELFKEGSIFSATEVPNDVETYVVYNMDCCPLDFPVTREIRDFDEIHWYPVLLLTANYARHRHDHNFPEMHCK